MQTDNNDNENYTADIEQNHQAENLLSEDQQSEPILDERQFKLDDIELKIAVIAGDVKLSLLELQSLKRGEVFDIGELPPTVKLVINDVVIGAGYLVEVNGRIGVKIANVNHNCLNNANS